MVGFGQAYYNLCKNMPDEGCIHSSDVIMSAMACQITYVSIVCSTICPGYTMENIKLRVTGLCDRCIPLTKGQ